MKLRHYSNLRYDFQYQHCAVEWNKAYLHHYDVETLYPLYNALWLVVEHHAANYF